MSAAVMQRQAARDDKPYLFFAFSPERVLGIKRAAEVRSPAARRRHPRLANRRDSPRHIRLRDAKRARDSDDDRLTPPTSSDPSAALSNGRRRRRAAPREDPEDRAQDGTRTPARFDLYDISARRRVATDLSLAAPSLARRPTTVFLHLAFGFRSVPKRMTMKRFEPRLRVSRSSYPPPPLALPPRMSSATLSRH